MFLCGFTRTHVMEWTLSDAIVMVARRREVSSRRWSLLPYVTPAVRFVEILFRRFRAKQKLLEARNSLLKHMRKEFPARGVFCFVRKMSRCAPAFWLRSQWHLYWP
jgi:hypothetical protein